MVTDEATEAVAKTCRRGGGSPCHFFPLPAREGIL